MNSPTPPMFPPSIPTCFSSGSITPSSTALLVNPGSGEVAPAAILLRVDFAVAFFPTEVDFTITGPDGETIYAQSESIESPTWWTWETFQVVNPGETFTVNNQNLVGSLSWRASGLIVPPQYQ